MSSKWEDPFVSLWQSINGIVSFCLEVWVTIGNQIFKPWLSIVSHPSTRQHFTSDVESNHENIIPGIDTFGSKAKLVFNTKRWILTGHSLPTGLWRIFEMRSIDCDCDNTKLVLFFFFFGLHLVFLWYCLQWVDIYWPMTISPKYMSLLLLNCKYFLYIALSQTNSALLKWILQPFSILFLTNSVTKTNSANLYLDFSITLAQLFFALSLSSSVTEMNSATILYTVFDQFCH